MAQDEADEAPKGGQSQRVEPLPPRRDYVIRRPGDPDLRSFLNAKAERRLKEKRERQARESKD